MVMLMIAALASGCTESHLPPHSASSGIVHAVNAAVRMPPAPDGVSSIATMNGAVPGSPEPGAAPNTVVPSTWYGYPSILPVIGSAPNWVEVRLAQRPDGLTTWVPLDEVSMSSTPYQLILDLATEHLAVYE